MYHQCSNSSPKGPVMYLKYVHYRQRPLTKHLQDVPLIVRSQWQTFLHLNVHFNACFLLLKQYTEIILPTWWWTQDKSSVFMFLALSRNISPLPYSDTHDWTLQTFHETNRVCVIAGKTPDCAFWLINANVLSMVLTSIIIHHMKKKKRRKNLIFPICKTIGSPQCSKILINANNAELDTTQQTCSEHIKYEVHSVATRYTHLVAKTPYWPCKW